MQCPDEIALSPVARVPMCSTLPLVSYYGSFVGNGTNWYRLRKEHITRSDDVAIVAFRHWRGSQIDVSVQMLMLGHQQWQEYITTPLTLKLYLNRNLVSQQI